MIRTGLILFITSVPLFFSVISVNAASEFDMHLSDFYQNQNKASRILREIESDLREGSRDRVCARQKEAAMYGIEATESLIKAHKLKGSKSQIESLKVGLDKWKELRDYC